MAFLEQQLLGNTLLQWFIAAGLLAGLSLSLRFLKRVTARRLRALAQQTETPWDDLIVDLIGRTHGWVIFLISLGAATLAIDLPGNWGANLRVVMVVGLIIQAGVWAGEVLGHSLSRAAQRHADDEGAPTVDTGPYALLRLAGRIIIWAAVMLLILDNVGVDITALVAGLGIGGIAVALAVQNILGDLFASVSILLDKPFVVGDVINVGEFWGTVEKVGLKTTRVRSLGGEQLVFSNADLLDSRIRNFKRMQERRSLFQLGVVYQTPPDRLEAIPGILREIIEANAQCRFDRAHFKSYGAFSLEFEVVYFVLTAEYRIFMDVQQAINLAIYRRFAEQGIEFAYPTQTLFVNGVASPSIKLTR